MYLQSKFRFWAFLPVGLLLLVTGLLAVVAEKLLSKQNIPSLGISVFLALFIFVWIWLVFGELRTKVIKVQINNSEILVGNFFGMGAKNRYDISQFDGFETSLLPSKYDTYEYLYLIKNGKKVVKISQFYHRNYTDLKKAVTENIQNLGQRNFSLLREIKEIFV